LVRDSQKIQHAQIAGFIDLLRNLSCEQSPVSYDVLGGVKMNFSDNLKIIRQQKKMTQTDIATQLHVSRQTISSWENGRSYPDIGMLVQISMAYEFFSRSTIEGRFRDVKTLRGSVGK
jgi:DNA-binding XRE family transcriptional regulator